MNVIMGRMIERGGGDELMIGVCKVIEGVRME